MYLDNEETSDSFMVFRNQIVVACGNARRSLKKKIYMVYFIYFKDIMALR